MTDKCSGCSLNYWKFIKLFYIDDEASLTFLENHGVIHSNVKCPNCKGACKYKSRDHSWTCSRQIQGVKCSFKISAYKGSFINRSKLMPSEILCFVNHWLQKEWSHKLIYECLGWGGTTSVCWQDYCYKVTNSWFENQSPIGGVGVEVEIDQSIFIKHERTHGYPTKELWMFGGIERDSKKCFIVTSDKVLEPSSLLPLIKKYILPGSIIYSTSFYLDCNICEEGYTHFVDDAESQFMTQTINNLWIDLGNTTNPSLVQFKEFKNFMAKTFFLYTFKEREHHQFFIEAAKLYPPSINIETVRFNRRTSRNKVFSSFG